MKILNILFSFIFSSCTTIRPTSVREFDDVTVKILNENGGGTGVIFKSTSKGSIILTNAHVCKSIMGGGIVEYDKPYPIANYKISKIHDLCFVFIQDSLYVNTVIAKHEPKLYSKAYITGHPNLYPQVLSEGYVSRKLTINVASGYRECDDFELTFDPFNCIFDGKSVMTKREAILVSALISPGSSGSGVFNSQGELIGLAFAGRGELNYAMVVPWKYLKEFVTHESKKLKWQEPGPDKVVVEYENPGFESIDNWRKFLCIVNREKSCSSLLP